MRSNRFRLSMASLAVVALSILATIAPMLAEPLDCPGGYQLEFVWDQFAKFGYPSWEAEFLVFVAFCGLIPAVVHAVRAISVSRVPLWTLIVAAGMHLAGRVALFDWYALYRYLPPWAPWHVDPWRRLAFMGAAASVCSLAIQAYIIVNAKPDAAAKASRSEIPADDLHPPRRNQT